MVFLNSASPGFKNYWGLNYLGDYFMKIFSIFLTMLFLCNSSLYSMDSLPQLPTNVENILNQHTDELKELLSEWNNPKKHYRNFCKKSWLPDYYIKYDIARFFNAEKLKKTIKKDKLDCLSIAEKYLYHVPGMPQQLSKENYLVIAKEALGKSVENSILTLKPVQQMNHLVENELVSDMHRDNYLVTDKGITIIDTDRDTMPSSLKEFYWNKVQMVFTPERVTDPADRFYFSAKDYLDKDSLNWLQQQHEKRNRIKKMWYYSTITTGTIIGTAAYSCL